jgi:hypothetical protein
MGVRARAGRRPVLAAGKDRLVRLQRQRRSDHAEIRHGVADNVAPAGGEIVRPTIQERLE